MSNDVQFVDRNTIARMIGKLTEDDLVFLNRVIVDRLHLIHQAKSTCLMARFHVGARVEFSTNDGRRKTGIIFKLNQKTASIHTDDGGRWNVSPYLLSEIKISE